MNNKRFETYDINKESRPPTEGCSSCEHYYTGACDGLRGWCNSYKQYRAKTLEELIKVAIGTTTIIGIAVIILQIVAIFIIK